VESTDLQLPCTCPAESTKVRLEHWQPQLVRGEAAFKSLLTTSTGEQEARARVARKTKEFMAVVVLK